MLYFSKALISSVLAVAMLLGLYGAFLPQDESGSAYPTMSRPGDLGEETVTLQMRLRELGYEITVTGVYDLMTAEAVLRFQESRGIDASGVANAETLYCLGLSVSLSDLTLYEERRFLASTLDAVCPDGTYLTKVALAGMLLRRMESTGFPDDAPRVVFSDPQLQGALLYDYSREPSAEAWQAVRHAANGMSPCPDALYFYRKGEGDEFLVTLPIVFKNGTYLFAAPPAE